MRNPVVRGLKTALSTEASRRSVQSSNSKTNIQMKPKSNILNRFANLKITALAALTVAALASTPALADDGDELTIDLIPSKGLPAAALNGALKNAHGQVKIESVGPVEVMDVTVSGLPPNTDFDFFVIQIPNKPFGLSWYQGDIETNKDGKGYGRFIGRFNIETFIVSPASVPAPVVFHNAFPDAALGPVTGRIHTYHLGLWFNSPTDGAKAGAPGTTPFNGEGDAGAQVLNTGEYPDLAGPLIKLKS
jgi:hypothetical protein